MEQAEIAKIVQAELDRAESYVEARISRERAMAYDYYYGRPFGNEVPGRSQIVSADVAQAIDSAVPAIVKIFVSGDKAVEFTPRGPEDVKAAEQATLSANYVFFTQNNGYALAHDFIKDGLLQKLGVFKWKWDASMEVKEKKYSNLDEGALQILSQDPECEILQVTPSEAVDVMGQPMTLYEVVTRYKKQAGRIKVVAVPPEEVKISPDATTLEVMDMPFIAHCPMLTASDLVEMGIPQDVIDELPQGDRDTLYDDELIARRDRTDSSATLLDDNSPDPSQKLYQYDECYIRVDEDGDGIAELRKICKVGDTILMDDVVDHIPMAIWTPKVMPHEVIGVSLADDVMDIQLWKSTLLRGINDSMYQSIAPRMFVQGDVNLDDVLTVRPGGVIRGEPGSSLTPIAVPFVGQQAFPLLEYADQEEEVRTGISRLFQGIDPQSINKTATGVNALMNQANARVELIARNAAEFGFKPLFKGIMHLLAKYQTQALMVRLTNQFVPVDPETWSKEYDMSCNVGLGTGTKEQQLMQLQALSMDLAQIAQSPFAQVLLDPKKIFNLVQKKAELAGFKDVTIFVNDPEGKEIPPPPPPPEIQKAKMQIEADQQKFQAQSQMDQQKFQAQSQIDAQKMAQDGQLQMQKAQIDAEVARYKAELDAQVKIHVEQMKAQMEHERELRRVEVDGAVGMRQADATAAVAGVKIGKDEEPEQEDDGKEEKRDMMMIDALERLTQALSRPKQIVRGKDGRAIGVQ